MANSASNIPEDLVTEILIQLPMKTLLICKSVCKTWLSIISNPLFIKYQLHCGLCHHQSHTATLLNIEKPAQESVNPELQHELLIKPSSPFIRINSCVMPRLFNLTRIISSCNGIICLSSILWCSEHDFFLWNPSVRQCKKLPFPRLVRSYKFRKEGFGYDSISDDYKVVRLLYKKPADLFVVVQVYSNNADSWREFETFIRKMSELHDVHNNIVANEVLYFDNEDELISFDLHKEVFGLVSLPSFNKKEKRRSDVMDFQDSVAVLFESGPGIIDLWTLDRVSGSMLSWTKKFSIRTVPGIQVYFFLGAGQFYGSDSSNKNHFLYDYESKEIKYIGLVAKKVHEPLKYSETLVLHL